MVVLGGTREKDQRCRAPRAARHGSARNEQRQRLECQHPLTPLMTGDSVISSTPAPRATARIWWRPSTASCGSVAFIGRVRDEPGDDLRRFHGHLPVGKPNHPHAETEHAAEQQHPDGAVHGGKYVLVTAGRLHLPAQARRTGNEKHERDVFARRCGCGGGPFSSLRCVIGRSRGQSGCSLAEL